MDKLGLNEIREKFLSFFESKGHLRLPSFPLIPQNDNSLLLINAGMAPLKPYFTGKETPPAKRVTTCQKCIRTPDIERVGKTARHGTFFEMLGNFSFGDYFKKEAALWAWEFVTKDLKMPVDRLWITIYQDDDEAFDIWTKVVGVAPERIVRLGKEDNFWEIGTGPCGPCSEIYFDHGEDAGCGGKDCAVGCDCDRFVEFWNLVFTQFDKDGAGNYNRLSHPNIDTGMGLERLAAIMQGVNNLFEVDTVRNIMLKISEIAGVKYGGDEKTDVSLRVITDHIRSTVFMVSDGVGPSNEGRGYVLRRLLRRAARHGKLLGIGRPFLFEVADTVINESLGAYPELKEKRDYIKRVIRIEEERFDETIDSGLNILDGYIKKLEGENAKTLDGESAFRLYDTYGFPIDLTLEILSEKGMDINMSAFDAAMNRQKERARSGRKVGEDAGWSEDIYTRLDKDVTTKFVGYDNDVCSATALVLIADNEIVDSASDGQDAVVIFDQTVVYGESGGQAGDTGAVSAPALSAEITNAKKLGDGKILHFIHITEGTLAVGDVVTVSYNKEKRLATARNHSATHLLQRALEEVLGSHVEQAGSYVNETRLRFDFSHYEAMTGAQIAAVEDRVNAVILAAMGIDIACMPIGEAREKGAKALFGEKYGEVVRVVSMGDYSVELCGGCHLSNTAQAGLFKILSEGGVAAGVRRIEATTGQGVREYIKEKEGALNVAASLLKVSEAELEPRLKSVLSELKDSKKENETLQAKLAKNAAGDLLAKAEQIGGISAVVAKVDAIPADSLRELADSLRDRLDTGVVVLASVSEGRISFASAATKSAVEKGMHSGNLLRAVSRIAGGGGGGRPDSASAGGKDAARLDEALKAAKDWIANNTNLQ